MSLVLDTQASLIAALADGQECQYVLNAPVVTIGRGTANEITLRFPGVSRQHARLRQEAGIIYLRDLGSTNGTLHNGKPIGNQEATLEHGDRIQLGEIEIRFLQPEESEFREDTVSAETLTYVAAHLGEGNLHTLLDHHATAADISIIQSAMLRVVVSSRVTKLIVRDNGLTRDFALSDETVIGRDPSCDIPLTDPSVSTQHATVTRSTGSRYILADLESRNGVLVNGVRSGVHELSEGDTIRIGQATLTFVDQQAQVQNPTTVRKRPVVLIPGFTGSELWLDDGLLWPNTARMLATPEPQLISDWQAEVRVGRAVREISIFPGLFRTDSFGWLVRFLEDELGYRDGVDLLEATYDWRQDNMLSSVELIGQIERWRQQRPDPTERVVLVAHSMGGLLARLILASPGGDGIERCIFLGTPQLGSATSLAAIIGGSGMLPLGLTLKKVHRLVREFSSIYQLFPTNDAAWLEGGEPFRPLEHGGEWLPPEYAEKLAAAVRFREVLAAHGGIRAPSTCIFGYGQKTLEGIRISREQGSLRVIEEMYSNNGDGTVAETSATWGESDVHPVNQQHGALFSDPDVLRRLKFELVERGNALVAANHKDEHH